jgi:hypothetical protein
LKQYFLSTIYSSSKTDEHADEDQYEEEEDGPESPLEEQQPADEGQSERIEGEEAFQETLQEAEAEAQALDRDSLLLDTLEETPEETRVYATLLEIDKNATRKKMHDGDYHHPFHKPNIAEDGERTFKLKIN